MDTITLECGLSTFNGFMGGRRLSEKIRSLKEVFLDETKTNINFILYEGIKSDFSGGRIEYQSFNDIARGIKNLNRKGIPYYVAYNGGLTLERKLKKEDIADERQCLDWLAKNGKKYGVANGVIITHEDLFGIMREEYPELKLIASCIQQLNQRDSEGYGEKFQKYDYVVPLNHHTTPEFLSQFREFSDKMILFLDIGCSSDLENCYDHYVRQEWKQNSDRIIKTNKPSFAVPSFLEDSGCFSKKAGLLYRQNDFSALRQMGVNKFKIHRGRFITPDFLVELLTGLYVADRDRRPDDFEGFADAKENGQIYVYLAEAFPHSFNLLEMVREISTRTEKIASEMKQLHLP